VRRSFLERKQKGELLAVLADCTELALLGEAIDHQGGAQDRRANQEAKQAIGCHKSIVRQLEVILFLSFFLHDSRTITISSGKSLLTQSMEDRVNRLIKNCDQRRDRSKHREETATNHGAWKRRLRKQTGVDAARQPVIGIHTPIHTEHH
jgi:hypothetical protein